MTLRLNFPKTDPAAYQMLLDISQHIRQSGLDARLVHLVLTRASQLNGCAFCLDMHTKEARAEGESEQRLYTLSAWRETPFFSPAERAALDLAEHVTLVAQKGVPEEVYATAAEHFEPRQLTSLLLAINIINVWNRIAITCGQQPLASAVSAGAAANGASA